MRTIFQGMVGLMVAVLLPSMRYNDYHTVTAFTTTYFGVRPELRTPSFNCPNNGGTTLLTMTSENETTPNNFREAEILGLQLMQSKNYEEALKAFQEAMKLPGSKTDVIRTKTLSGPSPVGGGMGGTESKRVVTLDEFEIQAANYNMACAYAQLGKIEESVNALENAFAAGFDNFVTVREDPDLDPVKESRDFDRLMEKYDRKTNGFNPFGLFGK